MYLDHKKLRQLREARYLSQAQLAEMIGSSNTNISRLENNVREVRLSTIVRLAKALDVHPDELAVQDSDTLV